MASRRILVAWIVGCVGCVVKGCAAAAAAAVCVFGAAARQSRTSTTTKKTTTTTIATMGDAHDRYYWAWCVVSSCS